MPQFKVALRRYVAIRKILVLDTFMSNEEQTLLSCPAGVAVRVVRLAGGEHFRLRLKNLGLVEGKVLTKVHSHPFGGPVTVRLQQTQLAIGHGMAKRIFVEASP